MTDKEINALTIKEAVFKLRLQTGEYAVTFTLNPANGKYSVIVKRGRKTVGKYLDIADYKPCAYHAKKLAYQSEDLPF